MSQETLPSQTRARPRVVVIGAGFGGVEAVRALARTEVDVTIVDRRNFHLFQPLLYQVATAALSPGDIAWPIRSIFRRQRNVTTLMLEVDAVDLVDRHVDGGSTRLPYDYLVIATGAADSYFGHDDWAPFAPGLKTIDEATGLRERLLLAFERAELTDDPVEQKRNLTMVVVGGGPTGVEMVGAMAELAHRTLSSEFRHIDPGTTRIVLIEAGPRVLSAFPEALSDVARRSLEAMRIEVRTGLAVTSADAGGVTAGDERFDAATVVWAAGVKASDAARWLATASDRAGRVVVEADLSIPKHPNVYVIGDTASVMQGGQPVPGVAPAAKQMGRYVGRRIARLVAGAPPGDAFRYRDEGALATIGRKSAVVSVKKLRLTGFVGWLFWCVAHVFFLIGFRSRVVVAFNWIWNYVTYQRGVRLITDGPRETIDDRRIVDPADDAIRPRSPAQDS